MVLLLLVCATAVMGQDLQFEVASIKPRDPNVMHLVGVKVYPGGRVTLSALSLKGLVTIAFGLSYWQVSGGEAWMEKEEFDIEAKPPEGSLRKVNLRYSVYGLEDENLRAMLRTLLIRRFQLQTHKEKKAGDVYELRRSGKPLRLKVTESVVPDGALPNPFGSIGFVGGRWGIDNMTMPQLAKFAADNVLHAPVVDGTGLTEIYDYKQVDRLSDAEANYRDPSDSFLRLIPEIGLKLERSKGTVDILVIDQASRPSPN